MPHTYVQHRYKCHQRRQVIYIWIPGEEKPNLESQDKNEKLPETMDELIQDQIRNDGTCHRVSTIFCENDGVSP